MNTLKTVLTTFSVLFLGAVLLGGGRVIWNQNQDIQNLQAQVTSLQQQSDATSDRLNKNIRITNKNFSVVLKREDKLSDIVGLLGKLIISESGQDPSAYDPNRTRSSLNEVH